MVSYKCAEKFYGEYDDGILWDDPELGVAWPLELWHPLELIGGIESVILAEKDRNLQSYSEFANRYGPF